MSEKTAVWFCFFFCFFLSEHNLEISEYLRAIRGRKEKKKKVSADFVSDIYIKKGQDDDLFVKLAANASILWLFSSVFFVPRTVYVKNDGSNLDIIQYFNVLT